MAGLSGHGGGSHGEDLFRKRESVVVCVNVQIFSNNWANLARALAKFARAVELKQLQIGGNVFACYWRFSLPERETHFFGGVDNIILSS